MSLAPVIAPAFLAGFCFLSAYLIREIFTDEDKHKNLPTLLTLTLLMFSFFFAQLVAKGVYDAQEECSMLLNETKGIANETHVTEGYTYREDCTSTVPESAPILYNLVMWLWRILPWAWLIFLIYWVFTSLADKEKLTRI